MPSPSTATAARRASPRARRAPTAARTPAARRSAARAPTARGTAPRARSRSSTTRRRPTVTRRSRPSARRRRRLVQPPGQGHLHGQGRRLRPRRSAARPSRTRARMRTPRSSSGSAATLRVTSARRDTLELRYDGTKPARAEREASSSRARRSRSRGPTRGTSSGRRSSARPVLAARSRRSSFSGAQNAARRPEDQARDALLVRGAPLRPGGQRRGHATVNLRPAVGIFSPTEGSVTKRPPVVEWSAVKKARFYNVQLWRGRAKVLTTWPTSTKLSAAERVDVLGQAAAPRERQVQALHLARLRDAEEARLRQARRPGHLRRQALSAGRAHERTRRSRRPRRRRARRCAEPSPPARPTRSVERADDVLGREQDRRRPSGRRGRRRGSSCRGRGRAASRRAPPRARRGAAPARAPRRGAGGRAPRRGRTRPARARARARRRAPSRPRRRDSPRAGQPSRARRPRSRRRSPASRARRARRRSVPRRTRRRAHGRARARSTSAAKSRLGCAVQMSSFCA